MSKLPNPKSADIPQINLVLDSGTRGQKLKTLRPDTNRDDPMAGFVNECGKALLLPSGLDDCLFHLASLVALGGFLASLAVEFPTAEVRIFLGLVTCSAVGSAVAAGKAFPPIWIHASLKLLALAGGALLTLLL